MLDLQSEVRGFKSSHLTVDCNPGQVIYTYVALSPSTIVGISHYAVMLCGWEGNYRSGMASAHASQTLMVLKRLTQGLGEGDEHLLILCLVEYGELYPFYIS